MRPLDFEQIGHTLKESGDLSVGRTCGHAFVLDGSRDAGSRCLPADRSYGGTVTVRSPVSIAAELDLAWIGG